MNFQDLKKIETAQKYIDFALRQATINAKSMRGKRSIKRSDQLNKTKTIEMERVKTVKKVLNSYLDNILNGFPRIDDLPEFYQQLIKITLEYDLLKKSLGGVNWAKKHVEIMSDEYIEKLKRCSQPGKLMSIRKAAYGRICSLIKRIQKELIYLEEARKIMRAFPSIKTGLITIALAGFPNVGKSTLLGKITDANPKIASYAFTTKGLNLGYRKMQHRKIQFVDTPGTLDRVDRMNDIERQAYLAMKLVAHVIVYVFDPTESYSLEDQKELLKKVKAFKKPMIIYMSKADIIKKEDVEKLSKKLKAITDADELVKAISKEMKKIKIE